MSISACLITKNEEKFLGGCLEHLKGVVKELIVVDTGSTDRTIEIAREKGARVSQIKWEDDFAKARNASLDKATGKWILIIDPDERLAQEDLLKIKALTEKDEAMAYSFNSRNYSSNPQASGFKPCTGEYGDFESGYAGYFESRKVRLFQNIPSIRFVGSVHELVESTISGTTLASDIPFHHYGSTTEVVEEKNKKALYRKHTEQKVKQEPANWKAYFELGVEHLGNSDYGPAVKALQKAYERNPKEALVLSNLGYALMEAGQHDEAEKILKECLGVDNKNHDAVLNLGVTEMRRRNWEKALGIFDRLIKAYPKSFLAFRNAGNCFARLKKYNQAAGCFQKALEIFPEFNEARIDLGVVCFIGGNLDLAEKILKEATRRDPHGLRAPAILDEISKTRKELAAKKSGL